MTFKHTPQLGDNDCSVAALAIISDQSYEKAEDELAPLRNKNGNLPVWKMEHKLDELGFLKSKSYKKTLLPPCYTKALLYLKWGDVYHYTPYWDGIFYDPLYPEARNKLDEHWEISRIYELN